MFTPDALAGAHVLVVDDDPATCEVLAVALQACGATVACAGSAAEALREIERRVPDVLVSDVRMRGGSGYDLIESIRTLTPERGGRVRAIALTGWTLPEERELALHLGFQRFLVKPVDLDDLVGSIRSVLQPAPPVPVEAPRPPAPQGLMRPSETTRAP